MTIPAHDRILIDSYEPLCDPSKNVVFRSTENVQDFFNEIRGDSRRYTLVSAESDYSIRLQADNHPNMDLGKQANFVDWNEPGTNKEKYLAVTLGPACDKTKCDSSHKYSAKVDAYTLFTFDDIPENIDKWYVTNLDVVHRKMEWLPFGLNNHGPGHTYLDRFMNRPKKHLLYVNFQLNSLQRVAMKNYFRNCPWVTFRSEPNLPVEQYLAEMAEHKFVLSPFGNGLDCYRNYEAMYLGTMPVIQRNTFSENFGKNDLPALLVNSYGGLNPDFLESAWEWAQNHEFKTDKLRLSYWEKRLRK